METIRSDNTNSLESFIVIHSGHHGERISDFEADDSYWAAGGGRTLGLLYAM